MLKGGVNEVLIGVKHIS